MPVFVIEKLKLNKMALSIVDKGASGDDHNRPEIVLFKRKKRATKMWEAIAKIFKGSKIDLEKMGLQQLVVAIDELGLNDEQKAGVLKLLEAFKSGVDAEPASEPVAPEKAEGDPVPPNPEEDEEMEKRAKEHEAALAKRDKRIQKLEDDAQSIRIQKRADELGFLPDFTAAETIELLKNAEKLGKEEYAKIDAMLEKVAKASKESPLLREAGAVAHDDDNSAEVVVSKRVKSMQDKNPEFSAAKCRKIVFKNDGKLYEDYRAARQQQ